MKTFNMIFIKPSGVEIEVSDLEENLEYCKSLGWKLKGAKKEEKEEIKKVSKKKKNLFNGWKTLR